MGHDKDSSALAEGLFLTDLSVFDFWCGYVARGGVHTYAELRAYLAGVGHWAASEYTLAAGTLNERLQEGSHSYRAPSEAPSQAP